MEDEAPPYRLETLNTLAFPKGKAPRCELTGLPATVQCITPHITLYYATREHAEEAWHGIVHKIAPLLGPLRAPAVVVGSEEDRVKYTMEMSKKALIDLCAQEASKFLVAGRYELALPGAIQALAFLNDVHGEGAVEAVAPYLQLAEANLGLGRFRQAEEFLSMANWSVLKNPDCSNHLRSQLHRNFGKLYSAQGKLEKALAELGKDIYCSSLGAGPEHVDTSPGYFHAAAVFYAQHRIENALAFYDKVVDIWYKFLVAARSDPALGKSLGESQRQEALDMLDHVLATRVKLLGDAHIATGAFAASFSLWNRVAADARRRGGRRGPPRFGLAPAASPPNRTAPAASPRRVSSDDPRGRGAAAAVRSATPPRAGPSVSRDGDPPSEYSARHPRGGAATRPLGIIPAAGPRPVPSEYSARRPRGGAATLDRAGEAKYTLGLLRLFAGDVETASDLIQAAAATYSKHLGPEHPSTRDILDVLQRVRESRPPRPDSAAALPSSAGYAPSTGDPAGRTPDDFASAFPFPTDMQRATTQSPIPLPPTGARTPGLSGFDPPGSPGGV